ncbi:3-oxoacyl-[acyl-carrier protein] reductase [Faunimonas pinastri]|uniref:3-oxoacyl-[acyl-carrier protein] reductase n=1 Tax=Faunimonas pinastri TaxID=1855383 RepID=A0A1H9Q4G5_9HYPH|nr:SDR family oxidoreductase [Faunimonas pinastri]SER55341.1 3-oxoacyl-[acyl-carrier protein] reductase [Faunimonas pinastri]
MHPRQKTALVTGASRGIGAAIARRLARDGFAVAVNYAASVRDADAIVSEIERADGHAFAVQADLADAGDTERMFDAVSDRFSQLDVVVHNAGIQLLGAHAEMDGVALDQLVAVNLTAAFRVLSRAARQVSDGGRILALSSGTTAVLPPRYGVYAATKAGVDVLIAVLAKELRGRGVTANAIAPGPVATDLYLKGKTEADLEATAARTPLGRLGQPDDIAGAIAFLAGPGGEWVNGQTILVNGGLI